MFRILAISALALVLAACGPREEEAVPTKGAVNLYTARHYDADLKLYDAFTKKTGIKVNRLEMAPDQLIERMKAEGEASPADVILMADAGALWRAEDAGLFQKITSAPLEAAIPASLRDPNGLWWGFSRRARVIAYDKAKVKPEEVATYESLAGPRFKGQVCVRSSDNVYNLSLMAALIERWGRDKALAWAKGVVANMARKPQGGDIDQVRAVGAGACQVALTNTYYFLRIATSENPDDKAVAARVALAFPGQTGAGTHVNISGGGVAAHAPNREAAVKFLEFLATPEAQGIFAGANHEYPAVPGITPPADVAAYSEFKADPMPVTVYGMRQAEAQGVYDQAGWR
jgi:iron(III) transport system substrate-binding protein